mmetsp:Transcript_40542/g.29881  ORF Transcript_40542/g.29881 Transcript_40542/m.29881 type:complete len:97 (+) Transcript_40542:728-1018(+)
MKRMLLPDLVNLLWCAHEMDRGSQTFYSSLENEIIAKISQINEEDLYTLLECFTSLDTQSKFSSRFMDLLLTQIEKKMDGLQLKTLVYLVWTLGKF